MRISTYDYYYGAFLSALLNNAGKNPSLFDRNQDDSRRIYRVLTDTSSQEYIIYTKFKTELAKTGEKERNSKEKHWIFNFVDEEIECLHGLREKNTHVMLALICVAQEMKSSELAFISYEQAMQVMGVDKNIKRPRINIKAIKGKQGLRMYGSGHNDKVGGKDNMIVVSRDALENI